jgi:hypothetical protein
MPATPSHVMSNRSDVFCHKVTLYGTLPTYSMWSIGRHVGLKMAMLHCFGPFGMR